jgi:uncharacterized protein YbjT (DUF2867 family)
MQVLLIGASGVVGSSILKSLCATDSVDEVVTINRKGLNFNHEKYRSILNDNISLELFDQLGINADVYISALGTTIKRAGSKKKFYEVDHDINYEFALYAKKMNAKSFILISAMGADSKSYFFYNRVKGQTEEDIKALKLNSLIFVRPSLLISNRKEFRFFEKVAIGIYKLLTRFVSKRVASKLGTKPSAIAGFVSENMLGTTSKIKIIEPAELI